MLTKPRRISPQRGVRGHWALLPALLALQLGCAGSDDAALAQASTENSVSGCDGQGSVVQRSSVEQLAPRFVYAANQNSHDISAYAVDAQGALSPVGAPIGVGRYPQGIALHPNGRSLFVADHGSSTVSALSVDATSGRLSLSGPAVANADSGPLAILAHPSGRWIFVGNDDAHFASPNAVATYEFDPASDGVRQISASETGSAGLLAMTLDRSGRFLYTANALGDSLTAFHVDACTGALAQVGEVDTPVPVALSASKSAQFLYVASNGPAPAIQTFAIDAVSGALSQVASLTGAFPAWSLRAMRLDSSERFLVLVSLGENSSATLSTLAIDAETGTPSATPVSSVLAGENATDVAIGPAGRFVYVSNFGSNDISSFSLDPTRGVVTALGSVPAGTAPSALAVTTGPAL